MSFKLSAANNGLLSYGITTNPDPLQASPASGNPSISSIVVTVSNNTMYPIYCNKLTFSFPIGTDSQDLTAVSAGIQVSANSSDKWQISVTSAGVFTATPIIPDNNEITIDGLSFQIYNIQTNNQVGTFNFDVEENSSTYSNKDFSDKYNTYSLAKFPYGFYVNNFAASSPMINDGATVILTWLGSDQASYTIFYNTTSVDVTNVRSWTSPKLNNTTTFSLVASVQENGETVDTYLYVTVIVANPELQATSLNVLQNTTLSGPAYLGSTLNVADTVNIIGTTTVNNMTVLNSLWVGGNTATVNTIVNGSLDVAGYTYLNNTNINGPLTATNTVSMMNSPQQIQQASYIANTDGFVVAQIWGPGNNGSLSFGNIYGGTGPMNFFAEGGNYTGVDKYTQNLNEGFTMPVSMGSSWYVGLYNWSGNKENSTATFWWIPMGNPQGATATFEKVSDEIPEFKMPAPILRALQEKTEGPRTDIADFITALSAAFHQTLSDETKKTLEEQLIKLIR
jgi:hypothetical protein